MGVVTVVLVLTGWALVASQRHTLTANLDDILRTQNRSLERALPEHRDLDTIVADEDGIAQIVSADGEVRGSTTNLSGQPALPLPAVGATAFSTLRLPIDESDYRVMSRSVDGVVLHTGVPIDDVEESVAALRTGLLAAIPAVALMIGALVWWLVGRTLRPVELIRSQVAGISSESLHQRVSEPAHDDEIARLARTMNEMLDRVEDATQRQQRFVADASHELRIPLTRMRSELEVDAAHPETADLAATHRSVLDEVDGLQRLVDDLLQLARSDAGTAARERAPVALDELALAEAARLRVSTGALIDTGRVRAATTNGDRDQLARAIRNLGDNAARHASSRIGLATDRVNGEVRFSVTDDGPGIPAPERARVFERFARLDDARAHGSGGTGLGLAITLEIVRRHGGTIVVDEPDGGGARFTVSLPAG